MLNKISIIGAGRVGQTIGRALVNQGYGICDVMGRHLPTLQQAIKFIGQGEAKTSIQCLREDFDVLLLTVPDNAIEQVAIALSEHTISLSHKYVFHFSGAKSSASLISLAERGMYTGSIHPLLSFSYPPAALEKLSGIHYCLEGDEYACALAKEWVTLLKGQYFSISADQKPLYHASAVLACGHLVGLLEVAFSVLKSIGVTQSHALLFALIESTLQNVKEFDTKKSLTGPFARGDHEVIRAHLKALHASHPEYVNIYKILGQQTLLLSSIDTSKKTLIQKILDDYQ